MNNSFWSLMIALAALLISVLSPIFTSIINNRHDWSVKRSEYEMNHRIAAIEGYIRAAGAVCGEGKYESFSDYWEHCGEIYLYLPKEMWCSVDAINRALDEINYDMAKTELTKLCKNIAESGINLKF